MERFIQNGGLKEIYKAIFYFLHSFVFVFFLGFIFNMLVLMPEYEMKTNEVFFELQEINPDLGSLTKITLENCSVLPEKVASCKALVKRVELQESINDLFHSVYAVFHYVVIFTLLGVFLFIFHHAFIGDNSNSNQNRIQPHPKDNSLVVTIQLTNADGR